jgi:hypothetical protein
MTNHKLFTGSREWKDVKYQVVIDSIIASYIEPDTIFHVGDALGVDRWVANAAMKYDIPLHVYGANKIREAGYFKTSPTNSVQFHITYPGWHKGMYLVRDKWMVEQVACLENSLCVAIWNGESRGCKFTYDYAEKVGMRHEMFLPIEMYKNYDYGYYEE